MSALFDTELRFGDIADGGTLNGSVDRFVFDMLLIGGGGGLFERPCCTARGACCVANQSVIHTTIELNRLRHTSFTAAVLASTGGRGGATVGRFIVGAGRKLIASCDWKAAGAPRIVPKCCVAGNDGPAMEIGGDLETIAHSLVCQLCDLPQ